MKPVINDKNWSSLQRYNWVADMHGIPQSPIHHAEGDVAIHTQMVLSELSLLPEYQALSLEARDIIWTAALMHDIEKRSTTRVDENGDIVSPGHSKKGAQTTNAILYRDFDVAFETRLQIVGLVRNHGLPLWSLEKNDPAKTVIKASLEVNTEWLYILAKADVMGRICSDKTELLERLEFFKELCIEQQCWGKARIFPSKLSRFLYFRKSEQSPDFLPYEDAGSEVIILSGIAGSGKDSFLTRHHPHLAVISLDQLRREHRVDRSDSKGNGRVIQMATEQAKSFLRNGEPFAWNATNITRQMRELLIDQFVVYKAKVQLTYIEVPYLKLLNQNKRREYAIPPAAIEKMIEKLEVPMLWEAHAVHYHIR